MMFLFERCQIMSGHTLSNAQPLLNNRGNIASSINLDLSRLKNWGSHNLLNFNAGKTQCRLISRRVDRNIPDISFESGSLEFRDKISMLGVILSSDLSWNDHIISVAKAAACKLSFLFLTKRFSTPTPYLRYTRLKFTHVSNIARICGEEPPSILLISWVQFRGRLSD